MRRANLTLRQIRCRGRPPATVRTSGPHGAGGARGRPHPHGLRVLRGAAAVPRRGRGVPRRAPDHRGHGPDAREHGADLRHPRAAGVHGPGRRAGLAGHDLAQGVRRVRGRRRLRVPAQRGARPPGRAADRQGRRHHRQDADQATAPTSSRPSSCRRSCATRSSSPSATPSPTPGPTPPPCSSRPTARRRRLAAQRPEDLDHLGPLRRVVLGRGPHRSRRPQAPRHHAVPRAARRPRPRDPPDLDDGRRAHQRGLLRRRVRARRLRGRRPQPGLPVHRPGARPRALHDVHLLPDRGAHPHPHRPRARGHASTASR